MAGATSLPAASPAMSRRVVRPSPAGTRANRNMTKVATSLISGAHLSTATLSSPVKAMLQRGFVLDTHVQTDEEIVGEMPTSDFLERAQKEMLELQQLLPGVEAEVRGQELRARQRPFELAMENRRTRNAGAGSDADELHARNAELADELDVLTAVSYTHLTLPTICSV